MSRLAQRELDETNELHTEGIQSQWVSEQMYCASFSANYGLLA